ncbi:MAG: Stp1/IreP family PP2C-type Ser/Thr phosphatase [Eubacteriales bacterium]
MLYFGKTDIGKKRKGNQDSFGIYRIAENAVLCAVCDGMGGAAGGEEASRTALSAFSEEINAACAPHIENGSLIVSDIDPRLLLENAAGEANRAVLEKAAGNPELHGMGTTLVALLVADGKAYSVNVGDSRLYRISDGKITQVTHDHSYVQYLVDIGKITPEEAKSSTNRNIIMRAVGIEDELRADIDIPDCGDGSKKVFFLLCSDGLSNMVPDDKIAAIAMSEKSPKEKTEQLIAEANRNGGSDNITAVLLEL